MTWFGLFGWKFISFGMENNSPLIVSQTALAFDRHFLIGNWVSGWNSQRHRWRFNVLRFSCHLSSCACIILHSVSSLVSRQYMTIQPSIPIVDFNLDSNFFAYNSKKKKKRRYVDTPTSYRWFVCVTAFTPNPIFAMCVKHWSKIAEVC